MQLPMVRRLAWLPRADYLRTATTTTLRADHQPCQKGLTGWGYLPGQWQLANVAYPLSADRAELWTNRIHRAGLPPILLHVRRQPGVSGTRPEASSTRASGSGTLANRPTSSKWSRIRQKSCSRTRSPIGVGNTNAVLAPWDNHQRTSR